MVNDVQDFEQRVAEVIRVFEEDRDELKFLTDLFGLDESPHLNVCVMGGSTDSVAQTKTVWTGRARSDRPRVLAVAVAGGLAAVGRHLTVEPASTAPRKGEEHGQD